MKVWRDGTILLLLGALEVPRQQLRGDGVVDRLGSLVKIGRELVLSLGGHGDARVGYGVRPNPQYLTWRGEQTAADIFIQEWTSLDPSEDPGLVDRIARELARAMGLPPEGPDS